MFVILPLNADHGILGIKVEMGSRLNLTSLMSWNDGLPRPMWDIVGSWAESKGNRTAQREAWIAIGRYWLSELATSFDKAYETIESEHFLAMVPKPNPSGRHLVRFAEGCRSALKSTLGDVAQFDGHGKTVILALRDTGDYYRYIEPFFPEGEHGGSGGVQIREGHPHIALYGQNLLMLDTVVAHELTHVSLQHLNMPSWIEEGLAQTFEHDMATRQPLLVDADMATRHKRYWSRNGLNDFWRGIGFSRTGPVQELSYQLAEILVRLLLEDGRPRWFGWVKEPQNRLFAFLKSAHASDCGANACQKHLGYDLCSLAATFLGPGDWAPGL